MKAQSLLLMAMPQAQCPAPQELLGSAGGAAEAGAALAAGAAEQEGKGTRHLGQDAPLLAELSDHWGFIH